MTLHINGAPRTFEPTALAGVPDLVIRLGLEPSMILIEHNGCALRRSEWDTTPLAEGDRIEILQVAAGG
jgi:sulfur carrier protein